MTVVTLEEAVSPASTSSPANASADLINLANGGYAATWLSDIGDGDGLCIRMRLFGSDGTPLATDFVVNTTATGTQTQVEMTQLADGRIVVVWSSSDTGDGSAQCIRARILNADGTPAGNDFIVNTTGTGAQTAPEITALDDGGFMITWTSADTGDGSNGCVRGRVYGSDGQPEANDFIVNTITSGTQSGPEMLTLSDGRVIVAWNGGQARFFEADGDPIGNSFTYGAIGSRNQARGLAELADGRIAVTFEGGTSPDQRIYVQILNSDGTASGAPISLQAPPAVDATVFPWGQFSQVVALADGGFAVTWDAGTLVGNTVTVTSVMMRVFNADGSPRTDDIQLFHNPLGGVGLSSALLNSAGELVVYYNTAAGGGLVSQTITIASGTTATALDDVIEGDANVNVLSGQGGDDSLRGQGGDDTLNGGDGNDGFFGGTGNDTQTGGAGDDIFYFFAGHGHDVIQDLTLGGVEDRIVVTGFTHYTKVQEGADLRIVFDANNSILIKNALAANFTSADINITLEGEVAQIVGTEGPDVLNGTPAADHIVGLGGNDSVYADYGDDIIEGGEGNDTLRGEEGDDVIEGGLGNDGLQGGYGDDILISGVGDDGFNGGDGIDTLSFEDATLGITVDLRWGARQETGEGYDLITEIENVIGSDHSDKIYGGYGQNVLDGGAGDDRLYGGDSDTLIGGDGDDLFVIDQYDSHLVIEDFVAGGAEDRIQALGFTDYTLTQEGSDLRVQFDADTWVLLKNVNAASFTAADVTFELVRNPIWGTPGSETINGTQLADSIDALEGDDTVNAGDGNDLIFGGDGADLLNGQDDEDDIHGGAGIDTINGGDGSDIIHGDAGADVVDGGYGDDVIFGGDDADTVQGGAGDDTIYGEAGADILFGGHFHDVLIGGAGADQIDGGYGIDTASFQGASGAVTINLVTQVFTGEAAGDTFTSIEAFDLSNHNDQFVGTGAAERIRGFGGDDAISTGDGADVIEGGEGNDDIDAGAGDDRIYGGAGNDTIDGGVGVDWLDFSSAESGVTVSLVTSSGSQGVDTVTNVENLQGSAFADILTGDGGANFIDGGAGNDIIVGGGGQDELRGGSGFDTADFSSAASGIVVDFGQVTGGAAAWMYSVESVVGSAFDDSIKIGGDANGAGGDDILFASAANQTITGGDGVDTVNFNEMSQAGAVSVNLAEGWATGATGSDTLAGVENVVGTSFADVIVGSGSANRIAGLSGTDTLTGGGGADAFVFSPQLVGVDATVTDFSVADDTIVFQGAYALYTLTQEGANTRVSWGDSQVLLLNVQASSLTSSHFQFDMPTITGDAGANVLSGTMATELILGLGGNDTLFSGGDGDVLDGGDGDDFLDAVDDNDWSSLSGIFIGGAGNDTVSFQGMHGGGGTLNFSLAVTGIQNITTTATGAFIGVENVIGSLTNDSITGDGAANRIEGDDGRDTLNGGDGDDVLIGGAQDDTVTGGAGNDTFVFNAADNFDHGNIITDFTAGGTEDRIVAYGATGYTLWQQGADVLVGFNNGVDVLLKNVQVGDLTAADIQLPDAASVINGTESGETLNGTTADDEINGLGGNDTLRGDAGNDELNGGEGDDTLRGDAGDDVLDGGNGNDTADYRNATQAITVSLLVSGAQNTGGAGTDTLIGIEYVQGGSGADTITGNELNNTLWGNAGTDTLNGGQGNDTLIGGAGADVLNGGGGLDYASFSTATSGVTLNFATGVHLGDAAGDTFSGIERYRLSNHADTFIGGAATDQVYGFTGADTLSGGGGIDKLYGQAGADTLNGDDGNDILLGGAGGDAINGGTGRDTASYEDSVDPVTINLATGVHTGEAAGDTFSSIEIFWLSNFNDTFTGSAGADEVRGAGGTDTLNGGDGADRLRGEAGNDVLNGEGGDDFLWGDAGADSFNGGSGTDTVTFTYSKTGVSLNLTTGVHTGDAAGDSFTSIERFQLTDQSTQADSFTGSSGADWVAGYKGADTLNGMDGNDTLNGGAHADVIDGGAGNDKLLGELGNDTLTGGAGADQFWFNVANFGTDTVTDFADGTDKIRITGIAGVDDFSDLTVTTNGSGWAVITLPDGSNITLTGTTAGQVDASDFLWI